ncbi:RING-H2 finger protein ATL16-like [Telopea speciosissima]|uniref:RING-H2 finger protein ATL16-like n=1 Tax=Telopea speciosissima TaxID=54955 RepID=UPI001CC6E0D9|nr:RING-H2 finger protein ATL16-like [Telopea speciosissima]
MHGPCNGPLPFCPPRIPPEHPNFEPPTFPSSSSSPSPSPWYTNFPIFTIAVPGIIVTSILLVVYYVFVIKCCYNGHRFDLLRRFSISQARQQEDPIMVYAPAVVSRGLDEALIRAIPIIQFKKGGESNENKDMSFVECAVCLNEFQEAEKLRVLPNCRHAFHIDCIDIWLQNNANCPLCRSYISSTTRIPTDQIISPTTSPEDPIPFTGSIVGSDEDFVVIDLRDEQSVTGDSGELSEQSISLSPRKLEQRLVPKKARKLHHMSSMGDECIDVREKDDQFSIQPIRRSISMDSSAHRQLYLSVQEIIQQKRNLNEISTGEGSSSSSSSRIRRSFFSFGQNRGSRTAVLPIQIEP